jgi:rare lipoprotein A
MKMIKQFFLLCLMLALVGCGGIGGQKDSAPSRKPNVANIPDAVPKHEPRSKYGNPAHYEVFGKRYYTLSSSQGYIEKGVASWYGTKFHGRRTSSGEKYDMYAMTAAHKTLPLPTYAQVTNLENGRTIVVKVNDRGPFHGNRLIDLSYSAATKLGIVAKGTGLVEVKALNPGEQIEAGVMPVEPLAKPVSSKANMYLQVGAFRSSVSADKLKKDIQHQIGDAVLIMPLDKPEGPIYRVRIGPLVSVEYADKLAGDLVSLGFNDAHIVIE